MSIYWKVKDFEMLFKNNFLKQEKNTNEQIDRRFISNTLSKYVRQRDKKCFICGTKRKLEAHHIFGVTHYPFLALYPENVITLCKEHHNEYHEKYEEANAICWSKFIKDHKIIEKVETTVTEHEDLINDDKTGTIIHMIRKEKGISHGKLLNVMEKYGVTYSDTERILRKLINRRTIREIGGEYELR